MLVVIRETMIDVVDYNYSLLCKITVHGIYYACILIFKKLRLEKYFFFKYNYEERNKYSIHLSWSFFILLI